MSLKLFGQVVHKGYPWKWRHTTSSYIAFLRTKSEHRMLESCEARGDAW